MPFVPLVAGLWRAMERSRWGPAVYAVAGLVAVYGLFALSASARAAVQIATKFGHAPVAYLLSAFAAVVYIIATVTLTAGSPTAPEPQPGQPEPNQLLRFPNCPA